MKTEKWWLKVTDEQMRKNNPHLSHLIGKNMDELHKMYPDARVCSGENCEFTDLDHAIFMEYDQKNIDDAKAGRIQVYYTCDGKYDDDKKIKHFRWWNGKKWVNLTQ